MTVRAAKALGQEGTCGLLAPGRKGNLAVLSYGPRPYHFQNTRWGTELAGEEGYRCLLTIAEGQIVYRPGEI